jgi:hypothetical protein
MAEMPNLEDITVVNDGTPPALEPGFDWKKSNGVKIGVAVGLVLLVVLIFCVQMGVFGGKKTTTARNAGGTTPTTNDQPAPPPPAPPAADTSTPTPPPAETPETQPATPAPTNATPGGTPSGNVLGGMPSGGNPNATDKPPLPDDFTKWDKEGYLRARKENHPKLVNAVVYLGQKFAGKETTAQGLIDLLKPLKAETDPSAVPGAYVPPPVLASSQLIEALVNALADNGTQPAKDTLKSILTGEFTTDDNRAATDAAIKCLAYHPSDENDDLLFQLLTEPESVRKVDAANPSGMIGAQATVLPAEMRSKAQELVKLAASEKLRLKLAEHFAKVGIDSNDPTVQFLLQEDPVNLNAQLALYRCDELPADTKTKLEQYFLNYASLAIGLTMNIRSNVEGLAMGGASSGGLPPGYAGGPSAGLFGPGMTGPGYSGAMPPGYAGIPKPGATREKMTDTERGCKLANTLWTSPLPASLAEELGEVRTMDKSASTIVLASAFPLDSVRAAMYRMLKKRQLDGPQVLDSAGWSDKVLNDPGTLVLVKMLKRAEPKAAKGTSPRTPSGPGYGGSPSPASAKAEAQKKSENDWFEESRKLVGLWCSRFEAAAQDQRKAARKGTTLGEPAPTKLDDFEFPKEKDTKIEEAYQLNWPEKTPEALASAKPGTLKVQYFRLTQTGTIKKTTTNFKRALKGFEQHDTDKGCWLEIVPKTTGSAPRRSIDVLVMRQDKSMYDATQKEDPTDLEIHVLAIEIADPGAN